MTRGIALFGCRLCLVVGLLCLPFAPLTYSVGAAPAAAPIVVNDLSDSTHGSPCAGGAFDCSLRDAINVANGGTFNNIRFDASWAGGPNVIYLNRPLPAIAKDGTWINGVDLSENPIDVFIDGQLVTETMTTISANYVTISNLKFDNGDPSTAMVRITTGKGNQIAYNRFSSYYFFNGPCDSHVRQPSPLSAIQVDAGVSGNNTIVGQRSAYIYGNVIGCAHNSAINVEGSYVSIGERADGTMDGNWIGNDELGHPMTTTNAIAISGNYNRVLSNQIVRNGQGALLWNSAAFNLVMTNTIRLNAGTGVVVAGGAHDNTVGSPAFGPTTLGNVISGNVDGISIQGSSTHGNNVFGNKIGTNATGSAADGNSGRGVAIELNAYSNYIGSTNAEKNVISGNLGDGVQIVSGAHDNVVSGNFIGADFDNTTTIPNGLSGIAMFNGARQNTIGGSDGIYGNLIRGSGAHGVYIAGSTTLSNSVNSNSIYANQLDGVSMQTGTHGNTIGAGPSGNIIANQRANGISVYGGAHHNTIDRNSITGSSAYGVLLDGTNTQENLVQRLTITGNGYDGIGERNNATNNRWSLVSMQNNGGLAIDKNAASNTSNSVDLPFPVVMAATRSGANVIVSGKANPTYFNGISDNAAVTVELYAASFDPSGYGEGQTYLGSAPTDASGNWQVTFASSSIGCYTAFETVQGVAVIVPLNFSSEFGPTSCRAFLPLILRNP